MFKDNDWSTFIPDPADADWHIFEARDTENFRGLIGPMRVRRAGDSAIIRLQPRPDLMNAGGAVHGATLLAFIDLTIFPALTMLEAETAQGVTLDVSAHFVTAANGDQPLDAVIELTNETRRMVFLRGTIEQAGVVVLTFMVIYRKTPPR